jgi:8-oxo-dGTP diphosphatase
MTERFYLESDGRIFLVARGGALDLPRAHEIPFRYKRVGPLACADDVAFCVPSLDAHPSEWLSKDAVPGDDRVTTRVREAVHATMPRVVSEGIIQRDERVLLVKGSRGLTVGRWTLPGGFVRFGEDPAQGLVREILEELGVQVQRLDLLSVRSKLGAHTRLHWTMFFYRVEISGAIDPDPDEIAEAAFFSPQVAAQQLMDPVMREVLAASFRSPQELA